MSEKVNLTKSVYNPFPVKWLKLIEVAEESVMVYLPPLCGSVQEPSVDPCARAVTTAITSEQEFVNSVWI